MDIDFTGKNILVTGAAGFGVGVGICEAVVAAGGNLIINDLDEEKAKDAANKYPNAIAAPGDISQARDVKKIFEKVNGQCGVVHGLVNNAGIGLSKKAHLAEEQEFDNLYDVDVRGIWLMSKTFVKQLLAHKAVGNIVNISSVHAQATMSKYAIYSSAKSAVNGLTRGMALELGELGIRCNSVAPGYIHAEQNLSLISTWTDDPEQWVEDYKKEYQSLKHTVSARDCGNAVIFLLSDLSRSITGQNIGVDAGFSNMLFKNSFVSE